MELMIKILADGLMLPIAAIAAYALIFKVKNKQRYDIYTHIAMAGLTSYLLAKLVGAIWQPSERRPFEELGIEAGASYLNNPGFPSDHALFAGFLAFAVWYATKNKWLGLVMIVLALLTGVGRIMAHVHSPLDVVGGLVFAAIGAAWYGVYGKKQFHTIMAKFAKK